MSLSQSDSARFGFPIARWSGSDGPVGSRVREMRAEGIRLVIARLPLEDLYAIHELESLGAKLMDVQSLYQFDYGRSGPIPSHLLRNDVTIRPYEPRHMNDLRIITAAAFSRYGHYFADPGLDASSCVDVYIDLVRRSCEEVGFSDLVLVAEVDGQTAGYLTFKIYSGPDGRYAAGGIGAVGDGFRGRDVFKMLVIRGLEWGGRQGCSWGEHEVLCSNYPVNKSFSSMGFHITAAFVTLHLWL